MPRSPQYRVVEATFKNSGRVEIDIGCTWKSERAAKEEMRQMKLKTPDRWLSLQQQA